MLAIRPATVDDVAEIAAIYGQAVRTSTASFEAEEPDEAEMLRRFETIQIGRYPYLVAVEDGVVAGYAYAGVYRPRHGYRNTVENTIYVDAQRHGRGIGRLLLRALVDEAIARGYRQMVAVIADTGNPASVRLHETVGFRHAGRFRAVGFKHGRWIDTILMQRELGEGDTTPVE